MLIPVEKINEAKALYDGQAIKEIFEHFGYEYDGKMKGILCPFHDDKNASFIWNPKANAAHCFGCNRNYDIIDLYLDQGMTFLEAVQKLFKNVGMEYSFDERGKQNKPTYKYPKREIGYDRTKVEAYLGKRKISPKTLDYADVQADENGNIVFHYYDANDVLLNTKYRPSRKIEPGENKCWFQPGASTTPILYNMNRIDPSKPLVITEGEIDTLSIIEAGYTNVVSVPTGAQATTWITECWDWLEQFQKIIIWSDNDSAGIKMRNECVRRLGSWRTFFVEIKDEDLRSDKKICKDANEVLYFYGKDRVLEYINNPIDTPIEGVIDLAEAEDFDMESAEGLYTGIEDLDKQIYKLVFGTVTLITGKAGCVDCDTEFFDGKCWKKISEYKLGDKVLQYNANGSAELVEPLQYHKYEANNLWHIETKYGIDMCVSDEHNMFYITSKNNLYSVPFSRFKQVHDRSVNGHPGRFITSFNYNGKGIDLTDDELKLMLAVICDGSFSNRNKGKFCRINIKKERKKIELENILKATGIKYTRRNREDGFSCFYFRAPIRTKQFTEEWYDCTQHQLNLIAENIYKWDGTQYDDSFEFFTTDKINANFIQFAYSACGYRASLRIDDRRGRVRTINGKNYITRSIDYNVYATHRNLVSIARKDGAKTPIVPYKTLDGYKYCFTVPSHMWIMRRNGSICITGNSGKSVFANQIGIAEALNQGYNCFVYSGELPAPVLRNWVETNLIGRENITMKNEVVRILNPTARQQLKEWYKGRVILYDDSLGVTSKSLLEKMEEAVRKLGCRVITIDNLMCIDLMCSENDRLEAEKTFVKDLVLFAKKFNVLIFLLAHPRKSLAGETSLNLQSISGASAIGNLCHMAFAIHRYTNKEKEGETNMRGEYIKGCEPKTYDTYIEVIKNRLTGLMPKIEVYFDFPSYRFYRTPSEVWKKYKWNKDLKPVSDTDPNSHTIVKESPLNG